MGKEFYNDKIDNNKPDLAVIHKGRIDVTIHLEEGNYHDRADTEKINKYKD